MDHDTVIYTIIGRDIFEGFNLPYNSTFDHKPIFTYYIYGLFNSLLNSNLYLIVSLICCISSAFILSKKNVNTFLLLSSLLIVQSVLLSNFSGNTEMLMLPFISAYILCFTSSDKWLSFIFIGALAAVLFNINYLAAVIMMPVTLYMFFSKGPKIAVKRILFFICGLVLAFTLIFLPFAFSSQSIADYVNLQATFLSSYAGKDRVSAFFSLSKFALLLLPVFIVYIASAQKDKYFVINLLLFLGGLLGAFASGHGYSHYLVPIAIPISLMFIDILKHKRLLAVASIIPLILAVIYGSYIRYIGVSHQSKAYLASENGKRDIEHLNNLAKKDNTALNIGSSHVIYWLSDARNINKFIFASHARLIYGANVDSYYLSQISRKPHLIMTKVGMCDSSTIVCKEIKKNYIYDSTSNYDIKKNHIYDSTSNYDFGYDLYRLKADKK